MRGAQVSLLAAERSILTDLVRQFLELVREGAGGDDPALQRLTPDAYRDDADAAREFHRLTSGDLLARRVADATVVIDTLSAEETDAGTTIDLDATQASAWLRTLSAIRLVIAERLGVTELDEHHPNDDRFGVYDWLGYRLDRLVAALDED